LRLWLNRLGVKTLFIAPGSPWENGYIESLNGKMRDELLNHEIFFTLEEAKTLIARWREEYNHFRPHSALGYRPPAPQAWLLAQQPVIAPGLTYQLVQSLGAGQESVAAYRIWEQVDCDDRYFGLQHLRVLSKPLYIRPRYTAHSH
jgi:hypothetical protein